MRECDMDVDADDDDDDDVDKTVDNQTFRIYNKFKKSIMRNVIRLVSSS